MPGIVSKILVSPVLPRCDTIFPVEAADIMAAGGKAQKGTDIGTANGAVFQHIAGGFTFLCRIYCCRVYPVSFLKSFDKYSG